MEQDILSRFKPFFEPQTIAVIGASASRNNLANRFIQRLVASSFPGTVYPVHPREKQIEGFRAYDALSRIPEDIDYAFIAIDAEKIPPLLSNSTCRIKFAHIVSSGFSETEKGIDLEDELTRVARRRNIRVVGPNCMGLHSPKGRLALVDGPFSGGDGIGLVSQSGGLTLDILRRGRQRGINFSALVSAGNCADVSVLELVEYFLADEQTKLIAIYIEQVRQGRQLFERLIDTKLKKPVVILKGGRTSQGRRAATSHTGALINESRLWDSFVRQTGSVAVNDIAELINTLVGFQNHISASCPQFRDVILFGNGGGISVVAADLFAQCGLSIAEFDDELKCKLKALDIGQGASIENPIDIPANALTRNPLQTIGELFDLVFRYQRGSALVCHLNIPVLAVYDRIDLLEDVINVMGKIRKSRNLTVHLVLRSDQDPANETLRNHLRVCANNEDIPTFDELSESAAVLNQISVYELYHRRRP